MINYKISKQAMILFVGINPHFGSYENGVPFSNNKTLWYLLSDSGLIKEGREFLKDDKNLKKTYRNIIKKYNMNFINIIDRPSTNVSSLRTGEESKGVERLLKIIKKQKPRVVCFIGKITFVKFNGNKNVEFGSQINLYNSHIYVMHFPLRGYADLRIKELKEVKKLARM